MSEVASLEIKDAESLSSVSKFTKHNLFKFQTAKYKEHLNSVVIQEVCFNFLNSNQTSSHVDY